MPLSLGYRSGKLWLQCGAVQRSLCIDVHTPGHTDQPVSRLHFILLEARAPSVRLVRLVAAFANRMLLVQLDELAEYFLDHSRPGNRLCHKGYIQHLLDNLQLPRRDLRRIRKQCSGGTRVLPKLAWRYLPSHDSSNVQEFDVPWC